MKIRMAAGLLVVAVGLGACGGDDDPTLGSGSEETTTTAAGAGSGAAAEHNDADVTFAQSMIVHHEQAIEMAQLAADRADSQEVLDLAARIEAAQQPEIEQMQGWIEDWDAESSDMGGDHMSGGMSDDDMTALEAANGAEFDRMFLEMMIEHHRGAITMAETEIADGQHPDAVELAGTIIEDQQTEIREMEGLLEQLG